MYWSPILVTPARIGSRVPHSEAPRLAHPFCLFEGFAALAPPRNIMCLKEKWGAQASQFSKQINYPSAWVNRHSPFC